jgi:3-oxoacyl-[acyl-carrier-protein] synthase-3
MIGVTAISEFMPERSLANADRLAEFCITREFLETKIGVARVTRMRDGQDTSDLCVAAFRSLHLEADIEPATVDCVVVCTQNPDVERIPHTSAIVHGKLGLRSDCASFDVSLGCSGYVYGLSVTASFMKENGLARGLLFTADPYSKIVNPKDKNTALLFGDAATVTLLEVAENGRGIWLPSDFRFLTLGSQGDALKVERGQLAMNGRAVFAFSATEAPRLIDMTLAHAGLSKDAVDLFLLHQGSKYIVDTVRTRLGVPPDKVPLKMSDFGNTVSSSIPLMLKDHLHRPEVSRIVLCGFGVGLSAASCLLTKHS